MTTTRTEFRIHEEITAALAAEESLSRILGVIANASVQVAGSAGTWIATPARGASDRAAGLLTIETAVGSAMALVGHKLTAPAATRSASPGSPAAPRSVLVTRTSPDDALRHIMRVSGGAEMLIVPITAGPRVVGLLGITRRTESTGPVTVSSAIRLLADSASVAIQQAEMRERVRELRTTPASSPAVPPAPSAMDPFERAPLPSSENEPVARPRALHLTPRERQILGKLIEGLSCKEVAAQLDLSARTVEHHVERLKARFAQPRLHALVGFAVSHGLCTGTPPLAPTRTDHAAAMRQAG